MRKKDNNWSDSGEKLKIKPSQKWKLKSTLQGTHGRIESNENLIRVTKEKQKDNQENESEIKRKGREADIEGRQRRPIYI